MNMFLLESLQSLMTFFSLDQNRLFYREYGQKRIGKKSSGAVKKNCVLGLTGWVKDSLRIICQNTGSLK